ncbi:uncharacterized protein LOC110933927 [Helianthus annuus]|uniref:uncharacterized protein LOC110933927 n=1 Tax=Helianthus annuus TaxID=4232 RepID=UPI000B8FE6D9|nr:uncharacterized protein LOC110933927 [Helianthus annuus]
MPPRKESSSAEEAIQNLCDKLDQSNARSDAQFQALQSALQQQMELSNKLLSSLALEKETKTTRNLSFGSFGPGSSDSNHPRQPKVTLPSFDGSNPLDWIFQANNFFKYFKIPDTERVHLTQFYFTGEALSWYKYLDNNDLLGSWPEFSRELELRFGPSSYANHQAALFKLTQSTTVTAYQTEFERLCNFVVGLPKDALLNCFISGLTPEIQSELAIYKPTTLHQAYGLSKLVEDKLNISKPSFSSNRSFTPKTSSTYSSNQTSTTTTNTAKPLPSPSAPLLPNPPAAATTLPFTKLSLEALQKRRAEGLCFRCPEKYTPGHKCNPPNFLLIADNEDDPSTPDPTVQLPPPTPNNDPNQFFSLSPAAFMGFPSPQALRVTGYVNNQAVQVLIDCGSTHDIIQPRIVSFLKLPQVPIPSFSVMVGSGDHIVCQGKCPEFTIHLYNTPFQIPVFVMPVQGADVILGLSWLSTLGPLMADFSIPQITFNVGHKAVTLRGESHSNQVSPNSLQNLIQKNSVASLHAIFFQCETHAQPLTQHHDIHIQQLLAKYQIIFDIPKQLPPNRSHDHHIPTVPSSKPINVKPYRYPHYQKQVMTAMIQEMLKEGVIQPSQSPYSSPVLLVKKKDGSW